MRRKRVRVIENNKVAPIEAFGLTESGRQSPLKTTLFRRFPAKACAFASKSQLHVLANYQPIADATRQKVFAQAEALEHVSDNQPRYVSRQ